MQMGAQLKGVSVQNSNTCSGTTRFEINLGNDLWISTWTCTARHLTPSLQPLEMENTTDFEPPKAERASSVETTAYTRASQTNQQQVASATD